MSSVLHPDLEMLARIRDLSPGMGPVPLPFPKERDQIRDGTDLSARVPTAPNLPLSSLEQEILSICLNSPEDPRDVGILPALLSVERQQGEGILATP